MAKRRALLIPVVHPLDEHAITRSSVKDFTVYAEIKHAAFHEIIGDIFSFHEVRKRRIRMGSFAVLSNDFEGHDTAFLHPLEVLRALSAKLVIVSSRSIDIVQPDLRHGLEGLDELWYKGNVIIIATYLADAIVDNLNVQYRHRLYEYTYCYGRIRRVVRKITIEDILKNSEVVAKLSPLLNNVEKGKMIYEFFEATPTRWPWVIVGLVIDRARKWITIVNPDTVHFINVGDVEEMKLLEYKGRKIPLIVVKKLTLTASNLGDPWSRLDNLLLMIASKKVYWNEVQPRVKKADIL